LIKTCKRETCHNTIVILLIFSSHQSYSFLLRIQIQPIVGLPLYARLFEKIISTPALLLTGRVYLVENLYSNKGYDWLDLNSKQEGVRLVGFKYQKGYDWLNSQFHCSYLESRGVPVQYYVVRRVCLKIPKGSSIGAQLKPYLRGIDGDRDVTGSDRVCMRDRKLHHRPRQSPINI
jgi:hypothetical protein